MPEESKQVPAAPLDSTQAVTMDEFSKVIFMLAGMYGLSEPLLYSTLNSALASMAIIMKDPLDAPGMLQSQIDEFRREPGAEAVRINAAQRLDSAIILGRGLSQELTNMLLSMIPSPKAKA